MQYGKTIINLFQSTDKLVDYKYLKDLPEISGTQQFLDDSISKTSPPNKQKTNQSHYI